MSSQDESNCTVIGYLSREDKAIWPTQDLPTVSRRKNFSKSHTLNPLLTKLVWSRWLDIGLVLFSFASLWTSTQSWSINMQKKELGQYPTILRSIVHIIYGHNI